RADRVALGARRAAITAPRSVPRRRPRARAREPIARSPIAPPMSTTPWEELLAEHFPGYLLPEAYRRALPEDVAARFLAKIGGAPRQLFVLRAASVIAARSEDIRELALALLPDLAQRRYTVPDRRVAMGELRGHLDVHATLRRRATGRLHEIVARARTPRRRA